MLEEQENAIRCIDAERARLAREFQLPGCAKDRVSAKHLALTQLRARLLERCRWPTAILCRPDDAAVGT